MSAAAASPSQSTAFEVNGDNDDADDDDSDSDLTKPRKNRKIRIRATASVALAKPEYWGKPITSEMLQIDFNGELSSDGALLIVTRPTPLTKKSTPTEQLATITGKSLFDLSRSALFDPNGAPVATVLKRFPQCRIRYPERPNMEFWLSCDVAIPTPLINVLYEMGIYEPATDIWLWVHERGGRGGNTGVGKFKLPEGATRMALIQQDDTRNEWLALDCEAYTNFNCIPSYKHSRRTGFIIIRDLKFASHL